MIVKEMIELLKKCNQESTMVMSDPDIGQIDVEEIIEVSNVSFPYVEVRSVGYEN